ncbi:hypothetical protein BJ165DRAFT_1518568 [Panaeolus papilionaceus]|nr:hypothetical protein BJ165DRAFT_1518568 [Panaeolus papilionaceus]
MSTIRVDDGDPNLFTNGGWIQQNYGPDAYRSTISWAHDAGASKVVRFIGTSITVGGGLQPTRGTANKQLVVQFIIDGGSPSTYSPNASNDFQYVTYYQSPQLPLGEHVLTMVNMVTDDILLLDFFSIQANGGTAQILKSNGSPTPNRAPPPAPAPTTPSNNNPPPSPNAPSSAPPVTVTVQQPPSNSSPSSNQPSPSQTNNGSDNNNNTPHSGSNSNPPSSAGSRSNASLSNSATSSFSAGVYNPTTINANDPNNPVHKEGSDKTPIIIAVVTSVLLVLILLGILLFFIRKRRKKRQEIKYATRETLQVNPYHDPPLSPGLVASQTRILSPDKATSPPFDAMSSMSGAAYNSGTIGSASATGTSTISSPPSSRAELPQGYNRDEKSEGTAQRPLSTLEESGLPPYVA